VALSCNLSYWEARIGNSYFSTSHGKPGIGAALSSATSWIWTYQKPGIPGSWITRMMLTPSVDNLPKGSRVQATSCARRHCSQTQSSQCNTVSLKWIKSIKKKFIQEYWNIQYWVEYENTVIINCYHITQVSIKICNQLKGKVANQCCKYKINTNTLMLPLAGCCFEPNFLPLNAKSPCYSSFPGTVQKLFWLLAEGEFRGSSQCSWTAVCIERRELRIRIYFSTTYTVHKYGNNYVGNY
jgi:hypothetical protein